MRARQAEHDVEPDRDANRQRRAISISAIEGSARSAGQKVMASEAADDGAQKPTRNGLNIHQPLRPVSCSRRTVTAR
jgi:hypothetical protein